VAMAVASRGTPYSGELPAGASERATQSTLVGAGEGRGAISRMRRHAEVGAQQRWCPWRTADRAREQAERLGHERGGVALNRGLRLASRRRDQWHLAVVRRRPREARTHRRGGEPTAGQGRGARPV
jgi:hypothetical protein